mgnify:CR=1 FL=1
MIQGFFLLARRQARQRAAALLIFLLLAAVMLVLAVRAVRVPPFPQTPLRSSPVRTART